MNIKLLIPVLSLAALLQSCDENKQRPQQSLEEISKQELATALQERDELLSLVKEVSQGLGQIKQLESMVTIAEDNSEEKPDKWTRILSDIAVLKERIRQRKAQLKELEDKLSESTINSKELKETVEALQIQMDAQIDEIESLRRTMIAANKQIVVLNDAVDSLNATVSTVEGERDTAQRISLNLENELNTCYFVIATKAELKEHNIIESGFLRRTKLMKGDFDKDFFVMSDKRVLDTLLLNTNKAKILTNHPETSYEMSEIDGKKVINIKNADQFWSLSNYLVIQKN